MITITHCDTLQNHFNKNGITSITIGNTLFGIMGWDSLGRLYQLTDNIIRISKNTLVYYGKRNGKTVYMLSNKYNMNMKPGDGPINIEG